jgi:hypothetical protein
MSVYNPTKTLKNGCFWSFFGAFLAVFAHNLCRFGYLEDSSQFSVVSSQLSVLSSQFSVVSCQFSVVSSQLSVVRGQWSVSWGIDPGVGDAGEGTEVGAEEAGCGDAALPAGREG